MKVLEVTYSWPAETFICRHARALVELTNIHLTLATKSPAPSSSASAQDDQCGDVQVTFLPNFDHYSCQRKAWYTLKSFRYSLRDGLQLAPRDSALLWALDALQPDVIHFHFGTLAVSMSWAARSLGIPYTVSLRGSDVQVWPLTAPDQVSKLTQSLTHATGIHTVCDAFAKEATQLAPHGPTPTTIRTLVPLPKDVPLWQPPAESLRFVTVGRLHWRKAYHDLIRAMAHLPIATLDIVGDGPEKEHLLYLIDDLNLQERVRLHGSIPYDHFLSLLAQSTAFVQASIAEGFSNALAEAMALGIPVFATPVGGTGELIRNGENGVLIPIGDPKGIAEKLRMAIDETYLRQLGDAARDTALQEFNAEKHAGAFQCFYAEAMRSYNKGLEQPSVG